MGAACERMAQRFTVTRQQADEFALRSHVGAAQAWKDGHYADVMPVSTDRGDVTQDDAIRSDSSLEKLARLQPSFDKEGIVTPGNASGLTDGAAATLLMSAQAAKQRGLTPLLNIVDGQLGGVDDMTTEMLLGPAKTIPPL
jgi:acetyl-CoA acetyltransferase